MEPHTRFAHRGIAVVLFAVVTIPQGFMVSFGIYDWLFFFFLAIQAVCVGMFFFPEATERLIERLYEDIQE